MARIRTIKPDFFTHEGLFDLEDKTRLPIRIAFAGLWTQCDREGRFKWKSRTLKSAILPFDRVDFDEVLNALWEGGFIVKYTHEDNIYGFVPTFNDHQVINNREMHSNLPDPYLACIVTRDGRVDDACPTRLKHAQGERKGKEGKGKEWKEAADASPGEEDENVLLPTEDEKKTPPGSAAPPSLIAAFGVAFSPHWDRWKDYKKKQHRFSYKHSDSEDSAIRELQALSGGNNEKAALIIDQSISKGWKGLFKLNENSNGRQQHQINSGVIKPVPAGGFGKL